MRRYYLHRWPSQKAMKRLGEKVKARTGRNRVGVKDIRLIIEHVKPDPAWLGKLLPDGQRRGQVHPGR